MMEHIVPITDAKARLGALVREAEEHDVVLARHGRPAAVLIGAARFEALLEAMQDLDDRLSVFESRESDPGLRLSTDKIRAELGLLR
jgi:prevent-host-death family protein